MAASALVSSYGLGVKHPSTRDARCLINRCWRRRLASPHAPRPLGRAVPRGPFFERVRMLCGAAQPRALMARDVRDACEKNALPECPRSHFLQEAKGKRSSGWHKRLFWLWCVWPPASGCHPVFQIPPFVPCHNVACQVKW